MRKFEFVTPGLMRWFPIMTLAGLAAAQGASGASPHYVELSGHPAELSQDQILADLQSRFIEPLEAMKSEARFYFTDQAGVEGDLSLGLIVESRDESGEARLRSYIRSLEKSGFHGLPVKFTNVIRIEEQVTLLAGKHRAGSSENSFDVSSVVTRQIALSTVSAWEDFTNQLGSAFLSRKSEKFQNFLTGLLGGPDPFNQYATQVLSHDDEIVADPKPSIFLEGGAVINTQSTVSPFFYAPFVRNCWSAEFEHGMCSIAKL